MPEEIKAEGEPKKPRKKKGIEELRNEAIAPLNKPLEAPVAKTTYTFAELHKKKDIETKFIIPEILPAHSVAVFIGEDGIGKTQLCTQLALHICFKYPSFLGLQLNAEHHRALICATEDSGAKWIKSASKQQEKLEPNAKPENIDLHFMEASVFDEFEELKANLEGELKAKKFDVIIVDAFSDLFTLIDGEINSNKDARKLLSFLQHLCNSYLTTIIVIHHAAKTKIVEKRKQGKIFVEKDDSQGAGAITQKPRTVLALSNDPKSIAADGSSYTNYLHVVKANEMGKHYVKNAVQLEFNGQTLLHSNKGLVDIEMMGEAAPAEVHAPGTFSGRKASPAEIPYEAHLEILQSVFRAGEEIARKDLIPRLAAAYGVGNTKIESATGFLPFLLDNGYLVKGSAGMYKRKPAIQPKQASFNIDDEEGFS